jgi:hypothetical protein
MDVANKLDMMEVANAVEQAKKEVVGRFDFKNTNTTLELNDKDKTITLKSSADDRVAAALEVLLGRLVKRNVSPKVVDRQKVEAATGGTSRQVIKLRDGIDDVNAKKVVKLVKDAFPKVQASIQGNLVRCSAKSRDDLQAVIAMLREQDLEVPLQFLNFRD